MALFKILQGYDSAKPTTLVNGYCYFTIDTNMFYVDHPDGEGSGEIIRSPLNAQNAHSLTAYTDDPNDVALVSQVLEDSATSLPSGAAIMTYIEDDVVVRMEAADNTKMNKNNPEGTGYFVLNKKSGTTPGTYSFSAGSNNKASGQASTAIGQDNIASGTESFAGGNLSHATGTDSFAFGVGLKAAGDQQTVFGRFNIQDENNTYAMIVGGGDFTAASNIYTLDWDGNIEAVGNITTLGHVISAYPTDDEHLATLASVRDECAKVVQLIRITEGSVS